MGIPGLYSAYLSSADMKLQSDKLCNTVLIIDGINISAQLWRKVNNKSNILGGNYDVYGWQVKQFFKTLKSCKIEPIVVLDGIKTYLNNVLGKPKKADITNDSERTRNPILLTYVFYSIIRSMRIEVVRTIEEADNTIAALARAYDCPILSADGDFCLYGVKFIFYDNFTLSDDSQSTSLSCRIYTEEEMLETFGKLKKLFLPLALELLHIENRKSEIFKDFYKEITEHDQIPPVIEWLNKFESLDKAVEGVLKYISCNKKPSVIDLFEKKISEFATVPDKILRFLELSEEKMDYLKQRIKDQYYRYPGSRNIERPEPTKLEFTKYITAKAPKWWCQDFLTTAVPAGIINKLVLHYLGYAKDGQYKAVNKSEIPMMIRISELLLSSMEDKEYVFKLPIKDLNNDIQHLKIKKWSENLHVIRTTDACRRIKVINETLGIVNGDNILQFPEGWRLYLTTIIYWAKREDGIQNNDARLLSLLFTMLFGIIDKKLGFERYGQKAQLPAEANDETYKMLNVTKEDCVGVADFFKSKLSMNNFYFAKAVDVDEATTFESIFYRFQRCLQFTIQLNALLNCPFVPSPIQELYNGCLLYAVYTQFSRSIATQKSIDQHAGEILQKSAGMIRVFELLKKIVGSELDGAKWKMESFDEP